MSRSGYSYDLDDPEDPEQVAKAFDIARQLAQEIAFENDEYRSEMVDYHGTGWLICNKCWRVD